MSDTPETDAAAFFNRTLVSADLARQFERERKVALRAENELLALKELATANGFASITEAVTVARKHREENNKLREACQRLLDSPEVQEAWPTTGKIRAQKPKDTFSGAIATVRFRRLLAIHQILSPERAEQTE